MELKLFQVDAFASELFKGNPAAVIPLERWLPDATMQAIAMENNLSETAFFVPEGDHYHLRWMTPTLEFDFCGHATIATSHVILNLLQRERDEARYQARCGPLVVRKDGDLLAMDAPCWDPKPSEASEALVRALGARPTEVHEARDLLCLFDSEEQVKALRPDFKALAPMKSIIATARGTRSDFVSRFFAPGHGIDEDPVTGSAHSILTPFWAKRLGKTKLHALQISARGGELFCELHGERVTTAGRAVRFLEGTIFL
jgi:PhzF family phenazine biosynthesis protein